jgi:hypothetical protein
MAKKKKKTQRQAKPPPAAPAPVAAAATAAARPAVTAERFSRLYRLVRFLGEGPKTRGQLTAHAGLDVRGFYRDLEVLDAFGIEVSLSEGQYVLTGGADAAVARLPFPDPHLTLGEMAQLARGRTAVHRRLLERIDELTK